MSRIDRFKFRLYIVGNAPNSMQAIANLKTLCREHLPEWHEIEIVDVLREPHRALAHGVLVIPTLMKLTPPPFGKIIGNLSPLEPVLAALGLTD
jgi:circadian clock protein KaiB